MTQPQYSQTPAHQPDAFAPAAPDSAPHSNARICDASLSLRLSGCGPLAERIGAGDQYLVLEQRLSPVSPTHCSVFGPVRPEHRANLLAALDDLAQAAFDDESQADAEEAVRRQLAHAGHHLTGRLMDWAWLRLRPHQTLSRTPLTGVLEREQMIHLGLEALAGERGGVAILNDSRAYGVHVVVSGAADPALNGPMFQERQRVTPPSLIMSYPDGTYGGALSVFRYPGGDIGLAIPSAEIGSSEPLTQAPQVITTDLRSGTGEIHLDPNLFGDSAAPLQMLAELGWLTEQPQRATEFPVFRLSRAGIHLPRAEI